MKKILAAGLFVCFISGVSLADTFGTGANQFTIDFVNISGDTGDLGSWSAGEGYTFSGVNHGDYRIGTYEVTNDQWNKFKVNIAPTPVMGDPSSAYDENPRWTRPNVPTNKVSWYEAAQFVNWLNTSSGYQAAYKFSDTQGTSGYTLEVWQSGDNGYHASNPYRNSNAYYFLPTEDEWVKAAYWNGTNLKTWATVGDVAPTQAGWNFIDNDGYATDPFGPWNVGDGTGELNSTFDMMGNVYEWMESPYDSGNYLSGSDRGIRGGSYGSFANYLRSSSRSDRSPGREDSNLGFRVASVPEPCSLVLLALGGLALRLRKQ